MTQNETAATAYVAAMARLIERLAATQAEAVLQAGRLIADTVARDGLVYTFGSGHSLSVAVEAYFRAGGMACFDVIHDKTFGRAERLPGYAEALIEAYPVRAGDLLIVISNSGRNPLPVEMALEGRKRGLPVIGITSLEHSRAVEPRNGSGTRLCEVCDLVLDNCVAAGDAAIEVPGPKRVCVGPTSTLAGVFLINWMVAAAADELVRRGIQPPVFLSMNLDEGDRHNQAYLEKYKERIRGL